MKQVILLLAAISFSTLTIAQVPVPGNNGGSRAQPSVLSRRYQQQSNTQNGFYKENSGSTSDTISNFINRRNSERQDNVIKPYRSDLRMPGNSVDNENQKVGNNGNGNLNNTNSYRP